MQSNMPVGTIEVDALRAAPEFMSGNYDTTLIERLMKGGYFEQQTAIRKELAK